MGKKKKVTKIKRTKRVQFSLNDKEHDLICSYAKRYKIENRSRWLRETIMAHVLKSLDQDYPTLFAENEMRR